MSDKKTETSKKWRLCFSWTDGIASARMSVIVDLPSADQAGSPVAMIQSIAGEFGIPLLKCSEASAERMERDSDDDHEDLDGRRGMADLMTAPMTQWEYISDNIAPSESWFDVLRDRGREGWEAWHIIADANGWRTIYFKRPRTP